VQRQIDLVDAYFGNLHGCLWVLGCGSIQEACLQNRPGQCKDSDRTKRAEPWDNA
jgi:hypothetical protein